MNIKEITSNDFEKEVVNSDKKVLVDFNANWCGPCKMMRPILEELSTESNDYKIVSVNVDNEEDLLYKYGIISIPCLILFENGKEIKRNVGFLPKDEVKKILGY